MSVLSKKLSGRMFVWLWIFFAAHYRLTAQPTAGQTPLTTSTNAADQVAALQLQLTNAWHQVEAIVNQPVPTYRYDDHYQISTYDGGWFHPGASTPDFLSVDVRQSQQFPYAGHWVSSTLNPTMMFPGDALEFNAMTKLFYTNRTLPKKKLSEPEMLQINSLYRTIGHCLVQIRRLENPPVLKTTMEDSQPDANDVAPPQTFASIRRIPQQTRLLYGGIAVGALVLLMVALRFFRKNSG